MYTNVLMQFFNIYLKYLSKTDKINLSVLFSVTEHVIDMRCQSRRSQITFISKENEQILSEKQNISSFYISSFSVERIVIHNV